MSTGKSSGKLRKLPQGEILGAVFFRWLAVILAGLALAGVGWALWPAGHIFQSYTLTPERLVALADSVDRPALALAQSWQVQLDWPRWMWVGNPAQLTMTLEPVGAGSGQGAAPPNNNSLIVDVEADLTGMDLLPAGGIRTPLVSGRPMRLSWTLKPQGSGLAHGSLWFYLEGQAASGESVQLPVSEHTLDIRVYSLLGLGAKSMLYLSVGLLIMAVAAGLAALKKPDSTKNT